MIDVGIETSMRLVHSINAASSMAVTDVDIETAVRALHPINAR